MTLIELTQLAEYRYNNWKDLLRDAGLENTFNEISDTPLEEYDENEDGPPYSDELIHKTAEEANEVYHIESFTSEQGGQLTYRIYSYPETN